MKQKIKYSLGIGLVLVLSFCLSSCLSDEPDTIIVENARPVTDIPKDDNAQPNPDVSGLEQLRIPNFQHSTVLEDGVAVIRIDMTGVQDPQTLDWLSLSGTGNSDQNVWVEVDGKPKGIKVYNSADENENRIVPVDLVFTVDNSGSMGEEADVIASEIYSWAQKLQATGLDIRFGCVGYDVSGYISGALSFTDASGLYAYLNRYNVSGTSRTVGFVGPETDVAKYQSVANMYKCPDECGMAAIRFADEQFMFRSRANRIYVNFTDEPNQNGSNARFSVESLKTDWDTSRGTIHTVYSGGYDVNNYLMSEYTGGTVLNVDSNFTNVTLDILPVTDAMMNSYIVRFTDISDLLDGRSHTVKITIMNSDGTAGAERIFNVIFGQPVESDANEVTQGSSSTTFNNGFGDYKGYQNNSFDNVSLEGEWLGKTPSGYSIKLYFHNNRGGGLDYQGEEYVGDEFKDYRIQNGLLKILRYGENAYSDWGNIEIISKESFRVKFTGYNYYVVFYKLD